MDDCPIRFCIDEESFRLASAKKDSIADLVNRFIELITKLREDGQRITRWSGLESIEVVPNLKVSDLLYKGDTNLLDHDVRILLIHIINRCERWDDSFAQVEVELEIAGVRVTARSLNYVFEQVVNGHAMSCVCFSEYIWGAGSHEVIRGDKGTSIYFLISEDHVIDFYRAIIEIENLDEKEYILHARLAFPNLYFAQDIHRQFRRFRQSYSVVRPQVTRHLSVLNDDFGKLCEVHNHDMRFVLRILKSRTAIDISTESHGTRANRKAMQEREVIIDGETIVCEYHTKLTPTYDRIHFHPGRQGVAGGKIIVGIFAEHLTT
jgi:hypothetical protein